MPTSIIDTEALLRDVDLKKLIEDLSKENSCPYCKSSYFVLTSNNKGFFCHNCLAYGDALVFVMRAKELRYQEAVEWLKNWLIKQGVWHQPQTTITEADSLNAIGALIAARESLQDASDKLLSAQHELTQRIELVNKRIAEVRAATDKSKLEYEREAE